MKIILCQHYECDYLGETVSAGLYEGGHDIYEIPYLKHLHGEPDKDYILFDGNKGYTGISGFLQLNPFPPNEKSEEEILEAAKDADLIIAHSTRRYTLEALDKIIARLGKNPGNIILCCGEDHEGVSIDLINKYHPILFAKRELNNSYSLAAYAGHYGLPIVPLPFGAFLRGLPECDDELKEWDFFTAIGQTDPSRNVVLQRLIQMVKDGKLEKEWVYIGTNDNAQIYAENREYMRPMLDWKGYIEHQAASKIGISLRGFGRDTLHHWELTSFATLCAYIHPGIHIPYPFIDRKHCVYINQDLSNLEKEIIVYLENEDDRRRIAETGKWYCRTYHSTQARAKYLIDIAMKILSGERIRWEEYGL